MILKLTLLNSPFQVKIMNGFEHLRPANCPKEWTSLQEPENPQCFNAGITDLAGFFALRAVLAKTECEQGAARKA